MIIVSEAIHMENQMATHSLKESTVFENLTHPASFLKP